MRHFAELIVILLISCLVPFEVVTASESVKDERVEINVLSESSEFRTLGTYEVVVSVTNLDVSSWSPKETFVSYHWYDDAGNVVVWDGLRSRFTEVVESGEMVEMVAKIRAPAVPGIYKLAFDVVHEGIAWLSKGGTAEVDIRVTGSTEYLARARPLRLPTELSSQKLMRIPVEVVNEGGRSLSTSDSVFVSYHWLHADGSIATWDGLRTHLNTDIRSGDTNQIEVLVLTPDEPGEYRLVFDVVKEGVAWLVPRTQWKVSEVISIDRSFKSFAKILLPLLVVAFIALFALLRFRQGRSLRTLLAAGALAILQAVVLSQVISYRPDLNGMWADQATHAMAAFSIAYDFDTEYSPEDITRFRESTAWTNPAGLYLNRSSSGELYYSKPMVYASLSAPFVHLFGAQGPVILNFILFAGISWALFWVVLRRDKSALMAILVSSCFAISAAYIYVFPIHPDLTISALLFFAVLAWWLAVPNGSLSSDLTQVSERKKRVFLVISGVLFGVAMYEKLPFGIFLALSAVATFLWVGWRRALVVIVAAFIAFALLTSIHLSTIDQWSPYRGDRFYFLNSFPFVDVHADWMKVGSGEDFKLSNLFSNIGFVLGNLPLFLKDYFLGRHIGVIPYFGAGAIYLGFAIFAIRRFGLNALLLIGTVVYVGFYFSLAPNNYYGGSHSFGNRYFLQIFPALLLASTKGVRWMPAVLAASIVFMFISIGGAILHPGQSIRNVWGYVYDNDVLHMFPHEVTTALTIAQGKPYESCRLGKGWEYVVTRTDSGVGLRHDCTATIARDAQFLVRVRGSDHEGGVQVIKNFSGGGEKLILSSDDWERVGDPFGFQHGYVYQFITLPNDGGSYNVKFERSEQGNK